MSIEVIGSALAIVATNVALFAWLKTDINLNRSEASADRRDLLQMMNAYREDCTKIRKETNEIRKEFNEIVREIKEENKSFHGRLCRLEEMRNKDKS